MDLSDAIITSLAYDSRGREIHPAPYRRVPAGSMVRVEGEWKTLETEYVFMRASVSEAWEQGSSSQWVLRPSRDRIGADMNRTAIAKRMLKLAKELVAEGDLNKAKSYIKRIRNEDKRKYAEAYLDYVSGKGDHPDSKDFGLGSMAAQGVRLQLKEMGFAEKD